MPTLKNYTAEVGGVPISGGRRAGAEDFGGGTGLVEAGHGLQVAAKNVIETAGQDEARRVLVEQAKIRQRYGKELEDAELSGAPTDKIKERLEGDLANLTTNLQTKHGMQAAEQHNANTLNIFDTAVRQVEVRRADSAARTQGKELIAAQTARLTADPASLPIVEREIDDFFATFQKRLPPERVAELAGALKQQANVTAVGRLARLLPAETKQQLTDGKFDLSPEHRMQLTGMADEQIRAQRADAIHAREDADYQKRQVSNTARDEWFKDIMAGKARQADITADQRLSPEHREHLVVFQDQWQRRKRGEEKAPNAQMERDLMLRIHAPEGDPSKIYNSDAVYQAMQQAGGINVTQFRMLNNEVAMARDPNNSPVSRRYGEALGSITKAIMDDPKLIMQPAAKAGAVNAWAAAVRDKMEEERKANRNPAALFDPKHKDSVVTAEFYAPFILEAQSKARAATNVAAKAVVVKGQVMDGFEFTGGDPQERKNWKPVVKSPAPAPGMGDVVAP